MTKVGRNDPCPYGSGKKYKHCCLKRERDSNGPSPMPQSTAPEPQATPSEPAGQPAYPVLGLDAGTYDPAEAEDLAELFDDEMLKMSRCSYAHGRD